MKATTAYWSRQRNEADRTVRTLAGAVSVALFASRGPSLLVLVASAAALNFRFAKVSRRHKRQVVDFLL